MNTRQAAILGSSILTPDRLPGLAAWYSADYGVLSQVGGGTAFASASSQYVSVANNASIDPGGAGSFSYCFWFKREGAVSSGTQYPLNKYTNADRSVFWNFESGSGNLRFAVSSNNSDFINVDNGDYTSTPNAWHFCATWFDAVLQKVCSQIDNGTVRVSAATVTSVRQNTMAFTLGATLGTGYFNGSLDEITFHKRVLTADERTWLYNGGAGRTYAEADASMKTNLVSWWSMNAPASGNWLDQHGSNHLTPSASRPTATEGVTFNNASDGQTVRRWLDRSRNGRHLDQATLAKQPAFTITGGANGSPFLLFDGLASTMATSNFTLTQPYTQIIVARRLASVNGRLCDGAGSLDSGAIRLTASTAVGLRAGSVAGVNLLPQGEDEVFAVVWNGASTLFYAATNGVQTVSPGTTSPSGITIGSQAGGTASFANIRAFELIYFQGEVVPTRLSRYLKRRYGFDLT